MISKQALTYLYVIVYRAARGKDLSIFIRFPAPGTRNFDDMEVRTHTNETPLGLRRQIIRQLRNLTQITTPFKLDVYYSGENIDLSNDRTTIQQFGIRDKMVMQAKVVQSNVTNSPDSSEESSGGSPNHYNGGIDGPNIEAEECLPSVMMSMDEKRMEFLCQLCGLGSSIGEDRLREGARLLLSVLPRCRNTEKALREAFQPTSTLGEKKPYILLFNTEPAAVLYRLEVLYTMLFPASSPGPGPPIDLLLRFFISGGALMVVEMLTKNNFMPLADVSTKRSAYLAVLKLTKAVLTVTALLALRIENEMQGHEERVKILAEAMKAVPHNVNEIVLRMLSDNVAKTLHAIMKQTTDPQPALRQLVDSAIRGTLPDLETIRLLVKLASATSSGSLAHFSSETYQTNREPFEDDVFGKCGVDNW